MIYFEYLGSIIESMYLSDKIDNQSKKCNIFINPDSTFLRSVVVINRTDYPVDKIKTLVRNGCKVISRISNFKDIEGVIFEPYILKINLGIMWNGKIVEYDDLDSKCPADLEKELLKYDNYCSVGSPGDYKLYFPKIYNLPTDFILDSENNLSGLGWALQQVGVNLCNSTKFVDLDIIKTGKYQIYPKD